MRLRRAENQQKKATKLYTIDDTPYVCNYVLNRKCNKKFCAKKGGPCMATLDKEYAMLDGNGNPVIADEAAMDEAADQWFHKEEKKHGKRTKSVPD